MGGALVDGEVVDEGRERGGYEADDGLVKGGQEGESVALVDVELREVTFR